jgi:hypothetical protein
MHYLLELRDGTDHELMAALREVGFIEHRLMRRKADDTFGNDFPRRTHHLSIEHNSEDIVYKSAFARRVIAGYLAGPIHSFVTKSLYAEPVTRPGAIMHSLLILRQDVTEDTLRTSFLRYVAHLKEMGFVEWCHIMRIVPIATNRLQPHFSHHCAIGYPDLETEERCYKYVKANNPSVLAVHLPVMRAAVKGASQFFVTHDS